jgi:ferritin-like metal-binding protein YciE
MPSTATKMFNPSSLITTTGTWFAAGSFVVVMALSNFTGSPEPKIGVIPERETQAEARRLFHIQLSEIHMVETRMAERLGEYVSLAGRGELREALEQHRKESAAHADRLLSIFEALDQKPMAVESTALDGILASGGKMIDEFKSSPMLDAVIVAECRRAKHFEMSCYMNLVQTAGMIEGLVDATALLEETLREEKTMDELLEKLGETSVQAVEMEGRRDVEDGLEPRHVPQDE